jgi:hypothetical protein
VTGYAVVAAVAQQWEQKQIPPLRCGMTTKEQTTTTTKE